MRPVILWVGMGVLSVSTIAYGQVQIQIDSSQNRSAISPYIYGTNFSNPLPSTVVDTNRTTEHVVRLTGLKPSTKYFYSIGASNGQVLVHTNLFFVTSPPVGTRRPFGSVA